MTRERFTGPRAGGLTWRRYDGWRNETERTAELERVTALHHPGRRRRAQPGWPLGDGDPAARARLHDVAEGLALAAVQRPDPGRRGDGCFRRINDHDCWIYGGGENHAV